MRKTPTIFVRDWTTHRVTDVQTPGCEWVFAGEGIATRKLDGTCCLIRDGKMFRRREINQGRAFPADFEVVDIDGVTGAVVGWVPVGEGPEDQWHRRAVTYEWTDGTYELIGPHIQGNPERVEHEMLVRHGHGLAGPVEGVPRTFDGLREFLASVDMEGIVFHHPDGRMAKIKGRDFGLKRTA